MKGKKQKEKVAYAKVQWVADDIQSKKPEWSLDECEDFLGSIESDLEDRMIERGWDVIDSLLPKEPE